MNPLRKHALKLAGAVLAASGAWYAYQRYYGGPSAELHASIAAARAAIASHNETLEEARAVRDRQAAFARTLLAEKLDVLSARFRDGLARAAEDAGLEGVTVENGQPQGQPSPLLAAKLPSDFKRHLRREPDFEIVRGTLKGSGTLAQALKTLGTLQAQPWIHRVEGFSINPAGKTRDRVDLRVDVATVFAPALARLVPGGDPLPSLLPPPAETESACRLIADKNVFRRPPEPANASGIDRPIAVVAPPTDHDAEPPPTRVFAPYEDWKLTGVAAGGRTGSQAMFLNLKTGDRMTILKGGVLLDAIFVEGDGQEAVVEIGGKRFSVSVGGTLASRKPQG